MTAAAKQPATMSSVAAVAINDPRLPKRFWAKVEVGEAGCWLWMSYVDPSGYARFFLGGKSRYGHVLAYAELVGPVAGGLDLDHLCRVRACVNPAHLEPVTRSVNISRGTAHLSLHALNFERMSRTHCPQGHPYEGANLILKRSGARACRACKNANDAMYRAAKRLRSTPKNGGYP